MGLNSRASGRRLDKRQCRQATLVQRGTQQAGSNRIAVQLDGQQPLLQLLSFAADSDLKIAVQHLAGLESFKDAPSAW